MKELFSARTYLIYIAFLRLFVGYYFFNRGLEKVFGDFPTGEPLARMLLLALEKHPLGLYHDFISWVVLPFKALFSQMIGVAELLVGASLFLGLFVRVSSLGGIFLNLNYYLAFGLTWGGAQEGLNLIFILSQVVFFLSSAGRALGLDGLIGKGAKGQRA